jgi:hypothetical protein
MIFLNHSCLAPPSVISSILQVERIDFHYLTGRYIEIDDQSLIYPGHNHTI